MTTKRLGLRYVAGLCTVVAVAVAAVLALAGAAFGDAPVSGAIFTSNSLCTGTNVNIYANKGDVYVDGGPAHPGAAGLPDGEYYVKVTEPDATLLGTSIGATDETPAVVVNGEFATCYQLASILIAASDGSPGYDTTSNPGGEYKVWISTDPSFVNSSTKTDNFKVKGEDGECETDCGPPPQATLNVVKFYDANANGINDDGQPITGWKVRIQDGIDLIRYTPASLVVDPDEYAITEFTPVEMNWLPTTASPVNITVADGDTTTVEFGNLCVGGGGGLTLGFWSNRNGQALFGSDDLALMVSLNLRNGAGADFNPASYNSNPTLTAFRPWLLNANATNMAYMLSAQLAAMELNVLNGKVDGSAIVYAPGATDANVLGFITINGLMAEANVELGLHGLVLAGSPNRSYQEALKNALDKANNNLNFVQGTPCAFTFAP